MYDPDNSGNPLPGLGVHEHWNDPLRKQYSRNLGGSQGIELVAIPSRLVGERAARMASRNSRKMADIPAAEEIHEEPVTDVYETGTGESKFLSVLHKPFSKGVAFKKFYSGFISEDDDTKWFLTDTGIAYGRFRFFDRLIDPPVKNMQQFAYQYSPDGSKVWFATPGGVMVAHMPYAEDSTIAITYNTANSSILGDSIVQIATGPGELVWIGSDKGISGLDKATWLTNAYDDQYPEGFFGYYPITTMAANQEGDSLLVATRGAGVGRFYRNDVDGISGASPYARWGPCLLPSDNVYSICIDGNTQWYGTDQGLARHVGSDYMENWTAFTTKEGLVNNFVQAIAIDHSGKLWVGTRGGISVLDGSVWTNYTTRDGLTSNNILCIVCDHVGDVYLGTDNGFMVYNAGNLICFQ